MLTPPPPPTTAFQVNRSFIYTSFKISYYVRVTIKLTTDYQRVVVVPKFITADPPCKETLENLDKTNRIQFHMI